VNDIDLLALALEGDRRSLARMITSIESGERVNLPKQKNHWTLGVTGPPGVGKSTLIGSMTEYWVENGEKVAILAIDPSSPISGGSLLADRLRMGSVGTNNSVFIRSISSSNNPGGFFPFLDDIISLLSNCGWTRIVIETVGSGQSEIRVVAFADRILLVDGPDRGDIIQAEKAGILELSDVVVINKSDLPTAENTAKILREGLELGESPAPQIHLASALDGSGVPELVETLESIITHSDRQKIRIRELLLANWDSLLLNHPEMEQNLQKLSDGSKTMTEAIQDMASTLSLGGD
tara:strand:+ start:5041 stop:5922 length:882 start_codon:yes stop_codon:yes gene_type:complete